MVVWVSVCCPRAFNAAAVVPLFSAVAPSGSSPEQIISNLQLRASRMPTMCALLRGHARLLGTMLQPGPMGLYASS